MSDYIEKRQEIIDKFYRTINENIDESLLPKNFQVSVAVKRRNEKRDETVVVINSNDIDKNTLKQNNNIINGDKIVIKLSIPVNKQSFPLLFENLSFKIFLDGKEVKLQVLQDELEKQYNMHNDDNDYNYVTTIQVPYQGRLSYYDLVDIVNELDNKITSIITERFTKMTEWAKFIRQVAQLKPSKQTIIKEGEGITVKNKDIHKLVHGDSILNILTALTKNGSASIVTGAEDRVNFVFNADKTIALTPLIVKFSLNNKEPQKIGIAETLTSAFFTVSEDTENKESCSICKDIKIYELTRTIYKGEQPDVVFNLNGETIKLFRVGMKALNSKDGRPLANGSLKYYRTDDAVAQNEPNEYEKFLEIVVPITLSDIDRDRMQIVKALQKFIDYSKESMETHMWDLIDYLDKDNISSNKVNADDIKRTIIYLSALSRPTLAVKDIISEQTQEPTDNITNLI